MHGMGLLRQGCQESFYMALDNLEHQQMAQPMVLVFTLPQKIMLM
jgi:hypothetical protein